MTEFEVKDIILKRIAEITTHANSAELPYLANTLSMVERLGKPDPMFSSMTEALVKLSDMNKENKDDVQGTNNKTYRKS